MEVSVWQIETTERFDRWLMSLDDTGRACVLAARWEMKSAFMLR